MTLALIEPTPDAVPIATVTETGFAAWTDGRSARERAWLAATGFTGKAGKLALLPGPEDGLGLVVVGIDPAEPIWSLAGLSERLPEHRYCLAAEPDDRDTASRIALGWALGAYAFTRYKKRGKPANQLVWPKAADRVLVAGLANGIALSRDLINTPAEDLGPQDLEIAVRELASQHGASVTSIVGDDLLTHNYPMIHAVGRAAVQKPRLIDLTWGDPEAPKVTLVGKGVCFDSGGLDLKTASGMKMMKKDMGGAATLLGLAHAVMATGLKLRLRVLVPAVENAVAGNAFRPMDIFKTRKGLTVEIGNTDAEGRLVLGDALTEASREQPALVIDMATLTGAARVALGPDLPALFGRHDDLADALLAAGRHEADPLWRMPLWAPYRKMLDSKIADLNNASDSGYAGAVTAALYLAEFVEPGVPWLHIDTFAWNPTTRPGRPEGGEALALRALYRLLQQRYG